MRQVSWMALVVLLTVPVLAEAREGQRSGGFESKRGAGTYSQSYERGKGSSARETVVTGQNGQSAERQSRRTWNREAGNGTYSSTTTGPRGKTTSNEGGVSKTGEGAYSYQGTATGPKGNSTNYSGTVTKDGDGQWSSSGTATGSQGKVYTHEGTRTKTKDGHSSSRTVTGENGKSASRAQDVVRDGTTRRTTTTSGPKGKEHTREGAVTVTPNRP